MEKELVHFHMSETAVTEVDCDLLIMGGGMAGCVQLSKLALANEKDLS